MRLLQSLLSQQDFQINKLDPSSIPTAPQSRTLSENNFFNLVAVKSDNTVLETFDSPVTFTITYGSDTESTYNESTLDVYKYTGSGWEAKSCTVDTVANTVTCTLPGFSVYALFGEANASSSNSTSSSSGSGSVLGTSTSCSDPAPEYAPDLFQIDVTDSTATIYFSPVLHTSQYYISYATNESAEAHGALVSLGSEGVQNFTVRELNLGTAYFFKVRGQRGCTPGPWSSIKHATTSGGSTILEPSSQSPIAQVSVTKAPKKIIARITPTKIPTATPTKKPTVQPTNVLSVTSKKIAPTLTPTPQAKKEEGYILAINILHEGKPLANAQVELHSKPRYGTTDENGFVKFEGVEKGTHTLYIAQNSYKAQEKIVVDGEDKQIDINVNVNMSNSLLPSWAWISIITLLLTVNIFFFIFFSKRSRSRFR